MILHPLGIDVSKLKFDACLMLTTGKLRHKVGLDHFEGRSWRGWHHHVTLVMLAHAFLRLEQKRRKGKTRWTLPQTRRDSRGYCARGQAPVATVGRRILRSAGAARRT